MKVWSLGDAVVDLLPLENMQYQACAGGAPANVAVGVAKLGCPSGFIGRVGDDPFGHFMMKTFEEQGVDCQSLEWDANCHTSTVVVDLAPTGERSFTFLVSPSADQFLTTEALPLFKHDVLHFCSLALVGTVCRHTVKQAIDSLKESGGLVSFDVNLRAQMWPDKQEMHQVIKEYCMTADILKLSDDELFWLTDISTEDWPEALTRVAEYPAKLIIITRGAQGSIVLWRHMQYTYPAYRVDCVDSTGAGDGFVAGLLAGIASSGLPTDEVGLTDLISKASACGALAATQKGAMAALPNQQQMIDFIQAQKQLSRR